MDGGLDRPCGSLGRRPGREPPQEVAHGRRVPVRCAAATQHDAAQPVHDEGGGERLEAVCGRDRLRLDVCGQVIPVTPEERLDTRRFLRRNDQERDIVRSQRIVQRRDGGELRDARRAPRRPQMDEQHAAAQALERERLAVRIQRADAPRMVGLAEDLEAAGHAGPGDGRCRRTPGHVRHCGAGSERREHGRRGEQHDDGSAHPHRPSPTLAPNSSSRPWIGPQTYAVSKSGPNGSCGATSGLP